MSERSDRVRAAFEPELDLDRLREFFADDVVFYAPAVGPEIHGRDAAIEILGTFVEQNSPTYRVTADPVEHGNFLVMFAEATMGDRTVELAGTYRFDNNNKVSGAWIVRG